MTTRHQVSLVTGVLILAIILPIVLSIWLATQQAKMASHMILLSKTKPGSKAPVVKLANLASIY